MLSKSWLVILRKTLHVFALKGLDEDNPDIYYQFPWCLHLMQQETSRLTIMCRRTWSPHLAVVMQENYSTQNKHVFCLTFGMPPATGFPIGLLMPN